MPFKDLEKRRQYDRERKKRIRDALLEKAVNEGDLNARISRLLKDKPAPQPQQPAPTKRNAEYMNDSMGKPVNIDLDKLRGESKPSDLDIEESQPFESEKEGYGCNMWHETESEPQPESLESEAKRKLKEEFGHRSE